MVIESYYGQSVTIKRRTNARGSLGGVTPSYSTHLTIAGRIRPLTGAEAEYSRKEGVQSTHRLYCAPADIIETDQVICDGNTYDIHWVKNPMNMSVHYEIDMVLRK